MTDSTKMTAKTDAAKDALPTSLIRVRISQEDVHYGGGVVAGAKIMEFFGDVATELSILHDEDEGLMAAWDSVEFKQPVHAGDFLEIRGRIAEVGRRSRKVEMEAYRVIEGDWEHGSSKASLLAEPVLVARARGTVVAPKR